MRSSRFLPTPPPATVVLAPLWLIGKLQKISQRPKREVSYYMQAICQINCQQLQPRGSEREAAGWEGQIEEWEEEEQE